MIALKLSRFRSRPILNVINMLPLLLTHPHQQQLDLQQFQKDWTISFI